MSNRQTANKMSAVAEKVRPHQPGQAVFKAIISDDLEWKSFPAFPASVRLAVVVGQPADEGPYVIRVRVPRDVKLPPTYSPRGSGVYCDLRHLLYRTRRSRRR
jgi:hypothetical protein